MVSVDRLLLTGLLLALMVQDFSFAAYRIGSGLVHVPWGVLDELRHVLKILLLDALLGRCCV